MYTNACEIVPEETAKNRLPSPFFSKSSCLPQAFLDRLFQPRPFSSEARTVDGMDQLGLVDRA
jgi:hypothetical protein